MNASPKHSETGNEGEPSPAANGTLIVSVSFVDISDDPLLLVAQFSSPPDVYNLCLTNQERFFRTAGNVAVPNTQQEEARGGNAPDAQFCTSCSAFPSFRV